MDKDFGSREGKKFANMVSVIQLEAIKWHPAADICNTCFEFLQSLWLGLDTGGIVSGKIPLGIVCI